MRRCSWLNRTMIAKPSCSKENVVARATLDTATRNLDVAKQSVAAAKAEEERARLAYMVPCDASTVSRIEAGVKPGTEVRGRLR